MVAVLRSVNALFNTLKLSVKHDCFLHYRRAEIFIFHSKKSFSLHFFNCQQRRISPAGSLFLTSLIQTLLTVASIPKTFLTLVISLSLIMTFPLLLTWKTLLRQLFASELITAKHLSPHVPSPQ